METLNKLIERYEREFDRYGMGSGISYSRLLTELKAAAEALRQSKVSGECEHKRLIKRVLTDKCIDCGFDIPKK